ncbi:MAG: hypothetical protein JNL11_17720 [Bdellovibrionaceae bacterium]|nr:hypothetical protein [Pseudobdellovibrionaceae bacterium]
MWIHAYELEAKNALNSVSKQTARTGFLTRKSNSATDPLNTFLAHSDFMYWPELGDPALKDLYPLLRETATQDLEFPFSLTTADLQPVKSNALISSFQNLGEALEHIQDAKFEVLKFKMGADFKSEFQALMQLNLKSHLVRIDLNNALSFKDSKEALEMLKKIPNLEYVEDPTPYHDHHWSELQKIVPLALDQTATTASTRNAAGSTRSVLAKSNSVGTFWDYRVVKPVRGFSLSQLVNWTYAKKKIVLTNMMDSVVGTWKTYLYYCELKKHIPHHLGTPGFHTHAQYTHLPFQDYLGFKGAQWTFDENKLHALNQGLATLSWMDFDEVDSRHWHDMVKGLR